MSLHQFRPIAVDCRDECFVCGQPDTDPAQHPQTRQRESYVNPVTGAKSSFVRVAPKAQS